MKELVYGRLCVAETGEVLVGSVEIARNIWQHAVGLIGRKRLNADTAFCISPCNGIHTFGMRFALDVLFLDRDGVVLRHIQGLAPFRIAGPIWRAHSVIELPTGYIPPERCRIGTRLTIEISTSTHLQVQ